MIAPMRRWDYLTADKRGLAPFPTDLKKCGAVVRELLSVVHAALERWLISGKRPLEK